MKCFSPCGALNLLRQNAKNATRDIRENPETRVAALPIVDV
jgi:hypothetical protein